MAKHAHKTGALLGGAALIDNGRCGITIMKSRYVKSLAIAALGILLVAVQAQLIDLGVAIGYAINNAGRVTAAYA
jgi:hypothetical protein